MMPILFQYHGTAIRDELQTDKPTHYPFAVQAGNLITRQGGYLSRCTTRLYQAVAAETAAGDQPNPPAGPQNPFSTPIRRAGTPSLFPPARRKYWALGAGENGRLWNEFQEKKIAALGWDAVGDLRHYPDFDSIKSALAASAPRVRPTPAPVSASSGVELSKR